MEKLRLEALVYSIGNLNEKDQLKQVGIEAYSVFEQVLLPEHWQTMLHNLQDDESFTKLLSSATPFVCRHKDKIVGIVYFVPKGNPTTIFSNDWAYIRMLGVLPQYRGIGIAHALVEKCIQYARICGEKILALHTAGYQQAWPIYERLGFRYMKDVGQLYGETYKLYTINL